MSTEVNGQYHAVQWAAISILVLCTTHWAFNCSAKELQCKGITDLYLMLLNQTSILKLNSTVKWLAHIIYNKEDQGQISIQTSDIVIKLSCVPLQLLEANAMLIPTI
jgi:hypothetical protein